MISIKTYNAPLGGVDIVFVGHARKDEDAELDLDAVRVCACVSHTQMLLFLAFGRGSWGGDESGFGTAHIPASGIPQAELLLGGLGLLASTPEYRGYLSFVRLDDRLFVSEESAPWAKLRMT